MEDLINQEIKILKVANPRNVKIVFKVKENSLLCSKKHAL